MSALIINFRFRLFSFFIFVITIMADEPVVVMAEPLESASDRDAASYRDASMRQIEMFLDKVKRLAEERISLGKLPKRRGERPP